MRSDRPEGPERQIERLFDEADEAIRGLDWSTVRDRADAVLALDRENADALAYRSAAEVKLAEHEAAPESQRFQWRSPWRVRVRPVALALAAILALATGLRLVGLNWDSGPPSSPSLQTTTAGSRVTAEQIAPLTAEATRLATSAGQQGSSGGSSWKIPTSLGITITIGAVELESIARRGMTVEQFAEATAEFVAPYQNPDLPMHPPGARDVIYARHGDKLAQAKLASAQPTTQTSAAATPTPSTQ